MLATRLAPKQEDQPLLALGDYLFNIFLAVLHVLRASSPSAGRGRAMLRQQGVQFTWLFGNFGLYKLRFQHYYNSVVSMLHNT
jgi:hypothetical protein